MKQINEILAAITLSLVILILGTFAYERHVPAEIPKSTTSAHVLVTYDDMGGNGSATHIGGGLYLTAAHVIQDGHKLVISNADMETPATLLWKNDDYDVALVRADTPGNVESVRLSCHAPGQGERVTLYGNPLGLTDIRTIGQIAGMTREHGPWKSVVPVDVAVGGGMSGGAMLDANGNFTGIIVGMSVQPIGMGGGPVGIAFVVPGSTVCMLMGKLNE